MEDKRHLLIILHFYIYCHAAVNKIVKTKFWQIARHTDLVQVGHSRMTVGLEIKYANPSGLLHRCHLTTTTTYSVMGYKSIISTWCSLETKE
ncbi:unnamed protein product [Clavelina lepadiformis]|uniref:Secreted protein n=1 Tax=Clavelina lepadiformis TaxID=159417 RepID=A0ABP0EZR9_CLALP